MNTWSRWVIRNRFLVLILALVFTAALSTQLRGLSVIIDPDSVLPQSHPYIVTNNLIEKVFGNKFTVIIGITAVTGDVFNPAIIEKVRRITAAVSAANGAVKSNINSITARKAKNISGNAEGMVVRPLIESSAGPGASEAIEKAIRANPVYENLLVSTDRRTTQIVAEFKRVPGGMKVVEKAVQEAVAPERDASVVINLGGLPIFLANLEKFSERMAFLFPIALVIIGLIHFEAFRTIQALALPLVTALFAVLWAVGFLALLGQPMDVFNASTPILILAIAAGHAVQILKRYYEEYGKLHSSGSGLSAFEMNLKAVELTLTKVGPVMITACTIAALGFFSLVIFEIKTIRVFGVFTGVGILSALVLEMTVIPALRCILPPPSERELRQERTVTFWDKLIGKFYFWAAYRRTQVFAVSAALVALLSVGGLFLKIDNSQKGYFYGNLPVRTDDERLNSAMGGTNPIYILVEGSEEDSIKDPAVLRGLEQMQRFLEQDPKVGKTVSLVDFLKRMNQAMNNDSPDAFKLPESRDLVAQYLLLYSNSGEPGDFDSYVDYGYQRALVQAFLKTDSSSYVEALATKARARAAEVFPAGVKVSVGGGATGAVALNEVMIREKVLNIVQIMGAVFIVSSIVFRSLLGGLLILVPLVAAVLVNFGVMGILGIPLQIATALVSAMAVGIGADYGIYMSYRMREELRQDGDEDEALKRAFKSAGKATVFVSTAVAGGFGVLMLSFGFMIHMWMGFLIAMAMLVSSITALTVFPALIFWLRPRFIYEGRQKMKPKNKAFEKAAAASLLLVAFASEAASKEGPKEIAKASVSLTADDIMRKNFVVSKVSDSTSESKFRLINSSGQERVRETKGSTKLIAGTTDNQRLVKFLSPSDVKGTKTLLIEHTGKEDDIWIFLPALKKVRRLVSNQKRDSFVGTDFSYGDVIGHRVDDWKHTLVREEKLEGKDCFVIESLPKTPAVTENSGYSKRVGWIEKTSFVALKGEIYDPAGLLLKKVTAGQVEKVDAKNDKWQPMRLEAENVQTGHKTVIEFSNFKAGVGVKDDEFTSRSLERQ
jgi:uncharacterized protein